MMNRDDHPIPKDERNDIAIRSRKHIDVTGVKEVLSFDESSVSMVTVCGEMNVEGESLKIGTLDTDSGIVSVDGKISAEIYYDEPQRTEKKKLFGKMLGR